MLTGQTGASTQVPDVTSVDTGTPNTEDFWKPLFIAGAILVGVLACVLVAGCCKVLVCSSHGTGGYRMEDYAHHDQSLQNGDLRSFDTTSIPLWRTYQKTSVSVCADD